MYNSYNYGRRSSRESVAGVFGALAVLVVAGGILRGFVLAVMWGWFIQPLGVPAIDVAQAIGIALIAAFLFQGKGATDDSNGGGFGEAFVGALATAILSPLFLLVLGWFIHLFM